ncbi:MAG: hypothetical protein ACP5ER_01770 [Candidatus Bathyarchaeales archaeon]
MYTLGHDVGMPPIFGDGLRYSGASPILSMLRNLGFIRAKTYPVDEKVVFEATRMFLRTEASYMPRIIIRH